MSDLTKEIANTVVRIKTEMRKASARPKKDNSQADLFEDEGGRRYSRSYRRSKEKELREKRKSGGPKVMGKAQFASRSEAGRYAANQRWKGQGKKGKGNADTAQLIAYRQAGNTKGAKLTEQKIEQRLAAEGKTSPAERMAAGLRDFKGKTSSEKQSYNHKNFMELRRNSEAAVDKAFSEKTLSGIGAYLRGEGKSSQNAFNPDAKDATAEDIAFGAQSLKEIKEIQEPLLDKASQAILDFDNGRATPEATVKALKGVRNALKREAVKADAKQKADGHFPESKSENTVRSMTYYTKARHLDIVAGWVDGALATIVAFNRDKGNYPLQEMGKARSFASRSEAGRYAANQRWKGQGKKTNGTMTRWWLGLNE